MAAPAAAAAAPKPPPLYASAAGEAAIRWLYDRALAGLPFAHEERVIDTPSFGSVHIVAAGPPEAPPLLLWHGTAAPAPFMLDAMQPLMGRYRVYCPDLPCQAGSRSESASLDPATHGHGRWAAEVVETLQALGLLPSAPDQGPSQPGQPAAQAALPLLHVGVSLGGGVLLDLAVLKPEYVGVMALVVPGSLHPDYGSWWSRLRVMSQLLLPVSLYRLFPSAWTAWLALRAMCDDPAGEELLLENIKLAFRHVRYFPPAPLKLTDAQLARLAHIPTLVIAAEHDIFGPGAATAARARATMPGCEAVVLPGAKHYGNTALENEILLDFFARRAPLG